MISIIGHFKIFNVMVSLSSSLSTLPTIFILFVNGPITFIGPVISMAEVYTAFMTTLWALFSGPAPGSISRHQMSHTIVTVPDLWRK